MNKTLQHFFDFLFFWVWFFFQFFPLLKTDEECFLFTVAFFNMLHSCWRQYCLNPSQYCYQNIKSHCQVSWYSNPLTRTRYKDASFLSLITSSSMWSCQESGSIWEGRTCLASSYDGGCSIWCWDPTDVFLDMLFFQKHHFIYPTLLLGHSSFKFIWLTHLFSLLYQRKALLIEKQGTV